MGHHKAAKRPPLVRFHSSGSGYSTNSRPAVVHRVSDHEVTRPVASADPDVSDEPFSSTSSSSSSQSSAGIAAYLRPGAFSGHRDTLARLSGVPDGEQEKDQDTEVPKIYEYASYCGVCSKPQRTPYPRLPSNVARRLMQYLSHKDYLNLRLTCRRMLDTLPHPAIPAVRRIPREILQLIYSFQEPHDFDATRHACRSWLIASLDVTLLANFLHTLQVQGA